MQESGDLALETKAHLNISQIPSEPGKPKDAFDRASEAMVDVIKGVLPNGGGKGKGGRRPKEERGPPVLR